MCLSVSVSVQVEQLEMEAQTDRESLRSAENLSSDLMKEKAQLQKTLETLRENSERQVHEKNTQAKIRLLLIKAVRGNANADIVPLAL